MSAADESPRRLTPTERLHEVTMAAMGRRPAEPESSVEITRNAKGAIQFSVTVRDADPEHAYTVAVELAERIEAQYPGAAVNGGTAE